MDIKDVLNNPGDEPRRRPRPSFSAQNSQSPGPHYQHASSIHSATSISPPAINSAHAGTNQGYFERQSPAIASSHSMNASHSLPPQTPVETLSPSSQYHSNVTQFPPSSNAGDWKREKSLSVSPKTVVNNLPHMPQQARFEHSNEYALQDQSFAISKTANLDQLATSPTQSPMETSATGHHTGTGKGKGIKRSLQEENESAGHSGEEVSSKRRRVREIPIWAQPAKKLKPLPKYSGNDKIPSNFNVEGHAENQPEQTPDDSLGILEESFRGDLIPYEELTKQICDFLFEFVVMNDSVGTGRVGETAKVEGQLEIEAKIGTIIDKQTHQRLGLPISSEAIIRPNFDIAFESMMTEHQHKSFNDLLNEALKDSHGPPLAASGTKPARPRVRMSYEHRHEVDCFYELPEDEISNLPQGLQPLLKSQRSRKPNVRVTKHKKTGQILSKIIKARIGDLHVVSPSTTFDWRVSVNVEANWDGDVDALIRASEDAAGNKRWAEPDRHKNRVSYTHQYCQIDLTQVKTHDAKAEVKATHELEVELDSAAVKEQGQLVLRGTHNQYQDLVKGFVDNVRILVRGVQ